jgi:hypothetical protein
VSAFRWPLGRGRVLVTRKASVQNVATDEVEVLHLDWATAWAIAGPQTHSWWWVRKWGVLRCGCTKNPVTRRLLTTRGDCQSHFHWDEDG